MKPENKNVKLLPKFEKQLNEIWKRNWKIVAHKNL